jgi:hypothetical protein
VLLLEVEREKVARLDKHTGRKDMDRTVALHVEISSISL